jgi:CheY-like chemotaxis protein
MMAHRVILADDSVAIHRVVNLTFNGEDVDIVSVHNGTDAIRKSNEQAPDLVIADIFMPGLNGYDVCARLRQQSATRNVPVILLVGAFESFDQAKASEVGATAHIMKPIEPQSLLKLVNGLLNQPRREYNSESAEVERNGADNSGDRSTESAQTPDYQPAASPNTRPQISLSDDTGNESGQMERFISSLQSSAARQQDHQQSRDFFREAKEPVRVFNLSEPEPASFVGEKPTESKKFIGQEDLVAHLSGEVGLDERAEHQTEPPIGIRTDELESLMGGLGAIVDPESLSHQADQGIKATAVDTKPTAPGTLVSPELVNEIAERVVTRLRETMRTEVKAAIEDALNQYLKDLEP